MAACGGCNDTAASGAGFDGTSVAARVEGRGLYDPATASAAGRLVRRDAVGLGVVRRDAVGLGVVCGMRSGSGSLRCCAVLDCLAGWPQHTALCFFCSIIPHSSRGAFDLFTMY